jgi:hypothetical protein
VSAISARLGGLAFGASAANAVVVNIQIVKKAKDAREHCIIDHPIVVVLLRAYAGAWGKVN